jgi:hypothetical protein
MGSCNLNKLNDVEVKEQYHVKISYRFAAFGSLDDGGGGDDVDISKAWESIRKNIMFQPQTV